MDGGRLSPKTKKRVRPNREIKRKPPKEVPDIEDISFSKDETLEIRTSLLEWYDKNQRDLPWRRICSGTDEREKRGYAVWVSEVMLQQTRVSTVIDYFNRWMNKWPTLHHLAQASLEEVNEMWAGLGYYRRVRFLLQGAKDVVEEGGSFPETVSDLRKIKGIGEYTAGAIASIAFKKAVPVVDGNVVRVISRLKAMSANPKDAATVKSFWKLAGQLVDPCRPGDFNQALMELGATLCSLSNPDCAACPISAHCHALSLSRQNESVLVSNYPTKVVKAKQRHEFSAVSVVEIRDCQENMGPQSISKYILVKRPNEGLLAGLWEFPSVILEKEADLVSRRKAIDNFLQSLFNLDLKESTRIVSREDIGDCVHIFSHIRLKMFTPWYRNTSKLTRVPYQRGAGDNSKKIEMALAEWLCQQYLNWPLRNSKVPVWKFSQEDITMQLFDNWCMTDQTDVKLKFLIGMSFQALACFIKQTWILHFK